MKWNCATLALLLAGCSAGPARIELTTYDIAGRAERSYASFNRAGYRITPGGLIEIAMETENPSSVDPTQTIRQMVYLKTIWYPQPGRTAVESTQLDATLMYALLTPPTGIRCDGSAMVTYKWNNEGKPIEALIESATLTPRYRMGDAVEPFGPARLVGTITLYERPGDVMETLQFLQTQFRERLPQATAAIGPAHAYWMTGRPETLLADSASTPPAPAKPPTGDRVEWAQH